MGTQLPLPQRGTAPTQFSAHIGWGQMAAWINMPLGMELGLSPGDFVLVGDPALPSPKRGHPIFGPFLFWPNGCMHQDATWYGGRPQPRGLCVGWGPSPPKFSAHVYYSYCDFVRTLHNGQSLLVCSSSSSSFSILCILFLEKKFNRTQSVPLCTVAQHSDDSWSRSCELVAF